MRTEQTIASLNVRLAEELTSIGRCLTHAERCAVLGHAELSDRLEGFAEDELRHAEELIGMIVSLEGGPTIAKLTLIRTDLEESGFENQPDDFFETNIDPQGGVFALEIVRYKPLDWRFYEADGYAEVNQKRRRTFWSSSQSDPRGPKQTQRQRSERQRSERHRSERQRSESRVEIMHGIETNIHSKMVVHASGKGSGAFIGTVAGMQKNGFIKLRKRDMPDGKRRYIPLEWVVSITGDSVHLSLDAVTVRREWLDKAMLKLLLKDDQRFNVANKTRASQNPVTGG
jgi:hypothetical protein